MALIPAGLHCHAIAIKRLCKGLGVTAWLQPTAALVDLEAGQKVPQDGQQQLPQGTAALPTAVSAAAAAAVGLPSAMAEATGTAVAGCVAELRAAMDMREEQAVARDQAVQGNIATILQTQNDIKEALTMLLVRGIDERSPPRGLPTMVTPIT